MRSGDGYPRRFVPTIKRVQWPVIYASTLARPFAAKIGPTGKLVLTMVYLITGKLQCGLPT